MSALEWQFFTFSRERPNFKKSGKLKRLKSLYSLSSCIFEALKALSARVIVVTVCLSVCLSVADLKDGGF